MSTSWDPSTVTLSSDAKPAEVQKVYDDFAKIYDKEIDPNSSYPALRAIVSTLLEVIGSDVDKNLKIIDLGAGTGHAAIELKKHGFTNIDGLDVSPEMLEKAKEKDAYRHYICEAVTEKRLDIATGTYDVVLSVGAVSSGYIKANAFDEIRRLAKPGGYVVFTARRDVFVNDDFGYAAKFQQLVSDGKWQEVKKYEEDYVLGHLECMKKCYILCYKVLKNE